MKYFRLSSATYEAVRAALDVFYGHPNAAAESCLPPSADWPVTGSGDLCIAVSLAILDRPEVAAQQNSLIAAGLLTEVDAAEFFSLQPTLDT